MKIVFVSFIDSSNIGDLLIAQVLEGKLMSQHTLSKYSFNFIPEKELSQINTLISNNKIKLLAKNMYNDYIRKLDIVDRFHWVRIKKNIDNNKFLERFEDDVKHCDLVVIGGGNAIFDLTKHTLSAYKFNKIFEIAKMHNKKTFVTSIGIGPFQTQKQLDYTIETLKNADYITVRDKKSFNYIKTIKEKVHLSIDPVFLLDKMTVDKNHKQNVISICVIDLLLNKDSMKKYKSYINNLINLVNTLAKENYKIKLFSTEPRDYRAVYDVYNGLSYNSNVNVVDVNDFNDLLSLYNDTNLIIGTRMHSMIIGLSQFIPVVGLSWQDKVEEMFKVLELEEYVFKIDDLANEIPSITGLVFAEMNNKHISENLQELKWSNIRKFNINNLLLDKLVDDIEDKKESVNEK